MPHIPRREDEFFRSLLPGLLLPFHQGIRFQAEFRDVAFSWVTQPLFGAPALPGTAGRGRPQPSAALSLQGRWPTSRAATFLPVSITPSSNALFKESGREEAVERPAGHCREQGASSPGLVRGAGAARGSPGAGGGARACTCCCGGRRPPPAQRLPPARASARPPARRRERPAPCQVRGESGLRG